MFFTVKKSVKIAGKTYVPCICYSLPKFMELTVKGLVSEGKAEIHEEFIYFQNGKPLTSLVERKAKMKAEKKAERKARAENKVLKNQNEDAQNDDTLSETEGF